MVKRVVPEAMAVATVVVIVIIVMVLVVIVIVAKTMGVKIKVMFLNFGHGIVKYENHDVGGAFSVICLPMPLRLFL